jgi:hypothetical protein
MTFPDPDERAIFLNRFDEFTWLDEGIFCDRLEMNVSALSSR